MTDLQKLAGASGMNILDVAQAYTALAYEYLIPREDTIMSVCTGTKISDGTTINLLTTQNWDGTLKVTDFIIPPSGYVISALTLSSGSFQAF